MSIENLIVLQPSIFAACAHNRQNQITSSFSVFIENLIVKISWSDMKSLIFRWKPGSPGNPGYYISFKISEQRTFGQQI